MGSARLHRWPSSCKGSCDRAYVLPLAPLRCIGQRAADNSRRRFPRCSGTVIDPRGGGDKIAAWRETPLGFPMSRMLLFVLVACLAACESHDPSSAADRLACREEVAKNFPDIAGATGVLYQRRQARSEKAYDDCLRARKEEEPATEESAKSSAAAPPSPMSCADPSCMTDEEQLPA